MTARALAVLDQTLSWCAPFLAPEGLLVTFLGPRLEEALEKCAETMERNARKSPLRIMLLPALLVSLSGCDKTPPFALIATDSLCKSWRHQTISKDDVIKSEETAAIIEGNNRSRPEWGCAYGKNEAKG